MSIVQGKSRRSLVSVARAKARQILAAYGLGSVTGDKADPCPGVARIEPLEDRRLMSVTASVSGASETNEGDIYTLVLTASTDGELIDATVDWGDGTIDGDGEPDYYPLSNPTELTHVYADGDANFDITVTAMDRVETYPDGTLTYIYSTDTTGSSVSVKNVDPTFDLEGDSEVLNLATYTVNATNFYDPGQDTVSQFVVQWGDGTSDTYDGYVSSFSHDYAEGGDYNVMATATDEDGSYSKTTSVTLKSDIKSISATGSGNAANATIVNNGAIINILGKDANGDAIPMTNVKVAGLPPGVTFTQSTLAGSPGKQQISITAPGSLASGSYTLTFSLIADPTVTCTIVLVKP
jgi:hypothetical protein